MNIKPTEIELEGLYEASYFCYRIDSDKLTSLTRTFLSRRHFLEALNKWNKASDLYKYWEV